MTMHTSPIKLITSNGVELPRRIHIIGIGGIGLSALARLLVHRGHVISGTEDNPSHETLDGLRAEGVPISEDLEPSHLPQAECYLYSDAWLTKHIAVLEEARRRGALTLSYFEALGRVAQEYQVIAVAGAHGKTTTTAMMIDVAEAGGLDPSAIVGSLRAKTGSNFRAGGGVYFIVEADEYRRHFLNFTPHILIITNIDADHLDYYKDLADIQSAFRELVQKIPSDGFVVCDPDNAAVKPVLEGAHCTIIDYEKYFDPQLPLKVLSLHRINAAAVLAAAQVLGISQATARQALADFTGTWRRFEYKGTTKSGAIVYDDYGHHPTEVKTTLESVRQQFQGKHLIVAFHPHLYSRTKILMKEFSEAFGAADDVILAPIFAAREAPDPSVTSEILAQRIRDHGTLAQAMSSLELIAGYLENTAGPDDIVLTMGAGDIYKVAETLVSR